MCEHVDIEKMRVLVWEASELTDIFSIFIKVWCLFVGKDCSSKSFLLKYIEDVEKAGR